MSHFKVIVIWDDIESQLEQYSENLRVPEYSRWEVTQDEKDNFINFYVKKNPFDEWKSFEELYKLNWESWNDNYWRKDTDWVWKEFSTYNPKSKWDWYEVWWRYAWQFVIKEWVEYEEPNFSWGRSQEDKDEYLKERRSDSSLKKNIDLDKMISNSIETSKLRYEKIHWLDKMEDWERTKASLTTFWMAQDEIKDVLENKLTEEEYIAKYSSYPITSYAIVVNWEWFERWEMWWFGMSSNDKDEYEWDQFVKEKIESCSDDTLLTIIDCHI